MQPLPDNLRPMNVSDILDSTFQIYRKNLLTFAGTAALVLVPVALLQLLPLMLFQQQMLSFPLAPDQLSEFGTNPFSMMPVGLTVSSILLSIIQSIILLPLMYGALTWATARRFQQQPVSITGAYSFGTERMLYLIGAAGMTGLGILINFAIPGGLIIFTVFSQFSRLSADPAAPPDMGTSPAFALFPLIFLLQIAAYVVVLGLMGKLLFMPQAVVIEGHSPLNAFRRSWHLTDGFYWRTIGILLLIMLLSFVVSAIFVAVLMAIMAPMMFLFLSSPDADTFNMFQGATTIFNILIGIITYPLYAIVFTLMYYDILARHADIPPEPTPQEQEELPPAGDV